MVVRFTHARSRPTTRRCPHHPQSASQNVQTRPPVMAAMMMMRTVATIVLVCSGAQGQGGVPSDTLPTLPPRTHPVFTAPPLTRGPPATVGTPSATLGSDVTTTGVQIGSTRATRTEPPITRGPPVTSPVTPTFCCDALVAQCECHACACMYA